MVRTFVVTQGNKPEHYFVKVTSGKTDWSGTYLLGYEGEYDSYIMYTDDNYSDGSCSGFYLPIEPEGIADCDEAKAGVIVIRHHAPDASGAVHSTAVAGKYTMFIQGSTGIGRYAGESFGFNNNSSYGRFVETISYDGAAQCVSISCKTKSSGEAYLKYDSAFMTFGFGLPSEMTEAGRYCDIQLYELR